MIFNNMVKDVKWRLDSVSYDECSNSLTPNLLARIPFLMLLYMAFMMSAFSLETKALHLLNQYREKANMIHFNWNETLHNVARGHAIYLNANQVQGCDHNQVRVNPYFTGVKPVDRAVQAGYYSRRVGENASYGDDDYIESIEGLFSAIYHRFGFLSFEYDEVGIGIIEKHYVYNMGNSHLNRLCQSPNKVHYGRYYTKVCSDQEIEIKYRDYQKAISDNKQKNPPLVVWPPDGTQDFYPAFFEEDPDPLPNSNVSGNPISIQFNDYYFEEATVYSIRLFEESGKAVKGLFMNKSSDPNQRFTAFEYAFFPHSRLGFDTNYRVQIRYKATPKQRSQGSHTTLSDTTVLETTFKTQALPGKWYDVSKFKLGEPIPISPDTTYTIYFPPQHHRDNTLYNRRYWYYGSRIQVERKTIDANLLQIKATGELCQYFDLKVQNRDIVTFILQGEKACLNASNPMAFKNRGWASYLKKEYNKAIQHFTQAIAIASNYRYAFYGRGWAFYKKEQYYMAIQDFDRAIAINPNYSEAFYSRGWAFYKREQYDKAIQDFDSAITIAPNYPDAFYGRGWAFYKKERYDKAIQDFDSAIVIDPNQAYLFYSRGWTLYKKGDIKRSCVDAQKAKQLGDDKLYDLLKRKGLCGF